VNQFRGGFGGSRGVGVLLGIGRIQGTDFGRLFPLQYRGVDLGDEVVLQIVFLNKVFPHLQQFLRVLFARRHSVVVEKLLGLTGGGDQKFVVDVGVAHGSSLGCA